MFYVILVSLLSDWIISMNNQCRIRKRMNNYFNYVVQDKINFSLLNVCETCARHDIPFEGTAFDA